MLTTTIIYTLRANHAQVDYFDRSVFCDSLVGAPLPTQDERDLLSTALGHAGMRLLDAKEAIAHANATTGKLKLFATVLGEASR